MIIVSPAKKLDFETPAPTKKFTQLKDLQKSKLLIKELKKCSASQVASMMKLSPSLTELNMQRYKAFSPPFNLQNAKQALFAFKGDTYQGLDADSMNASDINFAQSHLRILSGLYGLVAPLDLIQPYRLEMGTKFSCEGNKNLYEFWQSSITQQLNDLLKKEKVLINLASKEYFSAVNFNELKGQVITPVFKEKKGSEYKIVSFFAKKARGMMSRYILDHRLKSAEDILGFDVDGYAYNKKLSTELAPVFTRSS